MIFNKYAKIIQLRKDSFLQQMLLEELDIYVGKMNIDFYLMQILAQNGCRPNLRGKTVKWIEENIGEIFSWTWGRQSFP